VVPAPVKRRSRTEDESVAAAHRLDNVLDSVARAQQAVSEAVAGGLHIAKALPNSGSKYSAGTIPSVGEEKLSVRPATSSRYGIGAKGLDDRDRESKASPLVVNRKGVDIDFSANAQSAPNSNVNVADAEDEDVAGLQAMLANALLAINDDNEEY
jgi:hypothetical protein